ncbi:AraC family transcriptional regulator [Pseudozobellia sp. WGM2]|uniref:helix-turn-helix domain-containing protein n=1 Tax=Pseudozobellia sp. WGM2 TaxID=2787625 RepID=UPI001AE0A3EF|nr:response regulator transcription factor [Pseudozobellia sp. WGM2]
MEDSGSRKIFKEQAFLQLASNNNESLLFNTFRFEDFFGCDSTKLPYRRRDYYKITLAKAKNRLYYADKVYETKRKSLLFTNPMIPFHWEQLDKNQTGYFCVFKPEFFQNFGNLKEYSFFKPGGTPLYELSDEQYEKIELIFKEIEIELKSDYKHKNDLLRNLIFQIMHSAAKMYPSEITDDTSSTANERIATLFQELLEMQFPLENPNETIQLRAASAFATNLSVHVNHLNKVLKKKYRKSTSEIIALRILQEAKHLLRNTDWNCAEIAYCLAFKEATHFNNFFKKHLGKTPTQFRNI